MEEQDTCQESLEARRLQLVAHLYPLVNIIDTKVRFYDKGVFGKLYCLLEEKSEKRFGPICLG